MAAEYKIATMLTLLGKGRYVAMRAIRYVIACAVFVLVFGCSDEPSDFAIGKPAPDVLLEQVAPPFTNISTGSLKGKVVVMDFWATWCGPCRKTMPVIQKVYSDYQGKIEVMGVAQEPRPTVADFVKGSEITYPMVLDNTGTAFKAFNCDTIPQLYVIGKDGNIKFHSAGDPIDEKRLRSALDEALKA
jgi:thiol-disulfide isomerase/thioredoxin